jgi:hypothetical protein
MTSHKTITRALILGGGGATGVAWELGILTGLYDAGVDVRRADSIIGTSAGSMVGAQIASGTELESLFICLPTTFSYTPMEVHVRMKGTAPGGSPTDVGEKLACRDSPGYTAQR